MQENIEILEPVQTAAGEFFAKLKMNGNLDPRKIAVAQTHFETALLWMHDAAGTSK